MRRSRPFGIRQLRGVLVAALLLAAASGLGACTSARNALGPSESPCFRAIPLARAAVNDKGTFAGVRYLDTRQVATALRRAEKFARGRVALPKMLTTAKGPICAVAYRGLYDPHRVASGWSPTGRSGRLAIVIVRLQKLSVVATVVLHHSPLKLSKVFPPFL
jgi:hypothetical protein